MVSVYVRLRGAPLAELIPPGADLRSPSLAARTSARLEQMREQHAEYRVLLEERGARIISELSRLTNALHVRVPQAEIVSIERLPEVVRVDPVPLYRPRLTKTLDVVGAPAVWAGLTPFHGEGIRIGIVDSGVDYFHADFGGSGVASDYADDDPAVIEPGSFPTARVVGGWDLAGDTYDPDSGENEPTPDADPLDCGGHGTLVAGVAAGGGVLADGSSYAGPYDLSLDLTSFRVSPGVAPAAEIYALKVFGCDGPSSLVGAALELAADPNEDGVFDDRLDVVNLSLGSDFGYHSHTDAEQMRNLVGLGTVVVAAAGNADQIYYAAGSPGGLPEPIAAAGVAAIPNAIEVLSPASIAGRYMAQEGAFSIPLASTGPVTGDVVYAEPAEGCSTLTNGAALAGNLALIDRGTCTFVDKFARALAAGAVGVIVANYEDDLLAMGGSGTSSLPGVLIRRSDAQIIKGQIGAPVRATLSTAGFVGDEALRMWPVSSRGPSAVGNILKPDVSAPGESILSAQRGTGTDGRAASGTSFATPFVAGGAAILLQAQPSLTPNQLKAAMMASAQPVLEGSSDAPVSWQGSGLLDLERALTLQVSAAVDHEPDAMDPSAGRAGAVHASFGAVVTDVPFSDSRTVTVTNRGVDSVTYQLTLAPGYAPPGVTYTVEPASLTIAGLRSRSFTLSLDVDPTELGAPGPDPGTPPLQFDQPRHYINEAWGRVVLTDTSSAGDQSFSLPYHAVVRAAATRAAELPGACAATVDHGASASISVSGASAHPASVVSAFELGVIDEEDPAAATDPKVAQMDLRAVGVATNRASLSDDDLADLQLDFGVAISGQWSTPAGADVAIEIDADSDSEPDLLTVVQAFTLDGPYADVFASMTYAYELCENPLNLRTCEQYAEPLFANLVPRDEADTQPFLNSVMVLSVLARDLGLPDGETSFQYRAVAFEATEPWPTAYDETEWVAFDYESPSVDPSVGAPTPGVPLYGADEPVVATLPAPTLDETDPGYQAELSQLSEPAALLLLHHTNVAGQRWEVVDPALFVEQPARITSDFVATIPSGSALEHTVAVTNEGPYVLRGLVLEGPVIGATITRATAGQGTCTVAPELRCDLGDLAAGAAVTIDLELTTSSDGDSVELDLTARSQGGCEASHDVSVDVVWAQASAGGGCGCRTAGAPRHTPWAAALLLVVLVARLRREL
jgi:MYXO-CTERM domain-containing protein